MGHYTTLILHMSIMEDKEARLEELHRYLLEHTVSQRGFEQLGDEAYLATGTFKSLFIDEFLPYLGSIQWIVPEDVQLFIRDEHDTRFRIAYGKEEYDERLFPRNMLLVDAEDIFQEIARIITPNTFEGTSILADIQKWLNKHNELRKKEDE